MQHQMMGSIVDTRERMEYALEEIRKNRPLIYLACAYGKVPKPQQKRRYQIASEVAGNLLKAGNLVYSPLSHSHPMQVYGNMKWSSTQWLEYDEFYLERCDILMVLQLTNAWRNSEGILHEIQFCHDLGKPIIFLPYDGNDEPLPVAGPRRITTTEALEKAAQAWCTPDTDDIVMDSRLAQAFANILHEEMNK